MGFAPITFSNLGLNLKVKGYGLLSQHWRIRIVAECARLESVYMETYRGFKSLILRAVLQLDAFFRQHSF